MEFGPRGLAKILAAAGVDFVDHRYGTSGFDTERVADLMAWFKATEIAPFVRVPQGLYHFIARTLDAGALGIMVANVETGEQAKAIVSAKYAPMGNRGVGWGTAHNDYVAARSSSLLRIRELQHYGHLSDRIHHWPQKPRCHRRDARRGCPMGGALRFVPIDGDSWAVRSSGIPSCASKCG
jgi:hypothetical protein